ncbi:MAG: PP2C family protein-serine/threonine phosphatase [Planctomycetota bacterium]|nr:PP2C family protein-serine/threonine phosphatase [Planctomycetota bacterium]MDA1212676.1 PP2C family protein-serine/threonine phosphatase [Planctomycetota bacterium]
MNVEVRKFPKSLVWVVAGLTFLPWILYWGGVDFGASDEPVSPKTTAVSSIDIESEQGTDGTERAANGSLRKQAASHADEELDEREMNSIGQSIHTIMQWTAFCIALFTVVLSFTHYTIDGDVTTPIIGAALFFTGVLDAFSTIAADGLVVTTTPLEEFIPFTWAVSQLFNVSILLMGTGYFLWSDRGIRRGPRTGEIRLILLMGILFGMLAYMIIHGCAFSHRLPKAVYPEELMTRPLDGAPLLLYLFAGGIVFPRFYRKHPSLFSRGLIVSVIPLVAAEVTVAFGSTRLYDNNFNIALYQKILGYSVPLMGLILDYASAYRAEAVLRATAEQLRIAHQIQQGLLPQHAPDVPGYDFAGISFHTEAVGGDYFDYIPLADGALGLVVADVSGHDLGASLLMSQTRAYLRALTQTEKNARQIIADVNRFLLEDVADRRFVSLFFCQLDPVERRLSYCAAGQNGYILSKTGTWRTLEVTDPLLGITEFSLDDPGQTTTLAPGDLFVTLTDGIVEAVSPDGEQFGLDRVLETIARHRDLPSATIIANLNERAKQFTGLPVQTDDITLLMFKID